MVQKPIKPKVGDVKTFPGMDGETAFEVRFKKDDVVEIRRLGEPNVLRQIMNKYGNIRTVDGQLKQTADLIAWFLYDLTDSN